MSIDMKKIVLTGGSGGIGALVARELSSAGSDILVVDRTEPNLASARYLKGDLSTMEGIAAIAARLIAEAPDMLINLAGVQYFGLTEQQESDHVHMNYMVNLIAPVLLTQAVLPSMKRRGAGQIVNIGSILGSINFPYFVTYSSTKAGLRGFSEALRRELHRSGIDVTYIAPRAVRTGFNSDAVMRFAKMAKMTVDNPESVARQIVRAIRDRKRDVFIGFPERLFILANGLAPRLVDAGISSTTAKAKALFRQ
jgi:short-subunit dehydrogenase